MGKLTALWWSNFRTWERPAQIALVTALVLLLIGLFLLAASPLENRPPIYIGIVALFMVAQLIILWANRGMVTPFTQAQRAYLNEDFEEARRVMEIYLSEKPEDVRALTLLGNTYRQLGNLTKSEEVLTKALEITPNHHFPLYGFGRTLLAQGHYHQAADAFERALTAGAPEGTRVDLGEALYRAGNTDAARDVLERVLLEDQEPYRALMTAYLRYRTGGTRVLPPSAHEGLRFWVSSAERFAHTPYGAALAEDNLRMRSYIEETS